jgi:hypothetical protein
MRLRMRLECCVLLCATDRLWALKCVCYVTLARKVRRCAYEAKIRVV